MGGGSSEVQELQKKLFEVNARLVAVEKDVIWLQRSLHALEVRWAQDGGAVVAAAVVPAVKKVRR